MMWFKNKKQTETNQVAPRSKRRSTDLHSELGISSSNATEATPLRPKPHLFPGRAVVTDDTSAVYNEEVQINDLKVRVRRRLIGAMVLLATAFIILPWVFDDNRKFSAPNVTVTVPDKNMQFDVKNPNVDPNLKPYAGATDKPADSSAVVTTTIAKPEVKIEPKLEVKPEVKPGAKTEVKPAETAVADEVNTSPNKPKFAVHIGIVSTQAEFDTLQKKLTAAGVKPTRESIKVDGVVKTRIRLGPFDSQSEAQLAANKAKGAAKNPVVIPLK